MKRLVFILPVLLFAALIVSFAVGLRHDPTKITSTLIDMPLPAFALPTVRGNDAGLKDTDFRGEPMLLNVFASWCAGCRVEHPLLMRMKNEGAVIHGLDWKDEAVAGAQWLSESGDPYALAGNDLSGRTGIDLGVTGVPETFVIDGAGRVRYKFIGPLTASEWENTIRPLLQSLRAKS